MPLAIASKLRLYVATRAVPLGQFLPTCSSNVSALESIAKMTSTLRWGWVRGWRGRFWRSSPPSTRVRILEEEILLVVGLMPMKGLG